MLSHHPITKHNMCVLTSLVTLGFVAFSATDADARRAKELAQGAVIGSGVGVLVDGGSGILSGATAGLLVAAISRRGQ